jgi:hypothetical protein
MKVRFVAGLAVLGCTAVGQVSDSPDALRARINGMRADKVAWRQIQWRSCLLDGLRESRTKKKPLILWVFIDRPADDARC